MQHLNLKCNIDQPQKVYVTVYKSWQKKKIDKAKAKEENSFELYNLKIIKAKLDFQASEVTLKILKTELATKKIEMEIKIKQARLNEEILLIKKQKLENN